MAPPSPPPPEIRGNNTRVESGAIWGFRSGVESGSGLPLRVKKKRDWVDGLGRRESFRWRRVWVRIWAGVRFRVWVGIWGSGDWTKIWRSIVFRFWLMKIWELLEKANLGDVMGVSPSNTDFENN